MDYTIKVHPQDGDAVFSPEGFLHLGPAEGLLLGLFKGQYHLIEFSKQAQKIEENQTLAGFIHSRRIPYGE